MQREMETAIAKEYDQRQYLERTAVIARCGNRAQRSSKVVSTAK